MMPLTERRSPCPLACALDILGDRWTLLVVRDMLRGGARFRDFLASPEGIATNILVDRLERLVDYRLAEKTASPDRAGAAEYRLTDAGRALEPAIRALAHWALEHVDGAKAGGTLMDGSATPPPRPRAAQRNRAASARRADQKEPTSAPSSAA